MSRTDTVVAYGPPSGFHAEEDRQYQCERREICTHLKRNAPSSMACFVLRAGRCSAARSTKHAAASGQKQKKENVADYGHV